MDERHLNTCTVLKNDCDSSRVCCGEFCKANMRCDHACSTSFECWDRNTCCAKICRDTRFICCEYDFQCHRGKECNQASNTCETIEGDKSYFSAEMAFGGALVILAFIALRIYMACAYRSHERQRMSWRRHNGSTQSDEQGANEVDLPPPYTPSMSPVNSRNLRDPSASNMNNSSDCTINIHPIRGIPPPEYTPTIPASDNEREITSRLNIPVSSNSRGFTTPAPPPAYAASADDTRMTSGLSEPPPPYESTTEHGQGTGTRDT